MDMKKWLLISLVLLGIFLKGGSMATQIHLIPSTASVVKDQVFAVEVRVEPDHIAGLQLDIGFDPAVLQAVNVVQGPWLGAQSFFNPGIIDNTAGTIKPMYGVITIPGGEYTQAGILAVITFKAKAAGNSAFTLTNVLVGNKDGVSVPFGLVVDQVVVRSVYDLDGNGLVNISDLAEVADRVGTTDPVADFNKDGKVDILDMILLVQNYT